MIDANGVTVASQADDRESLGENARKPAINKTTEMIMKLIIWCRVEIMRVKLSVKNSKQVDYMLDLACFAARLACLNPYSLIAHRSVISNSTPSLKNRLSCYSSTMHGTNIPSLMPWIFFLSAGTMVAMVPPILVFPLVSMK